jgi:hypothetical protein
LLLRPVNENLAFDDKGLRLCANAGVDADQCAGSDPVVGITCLVVGYAAELRLPPSSPSR